MIKFALVVSVFAFAVNQDALAYDLTDSLSTTFFADSYFAHDLNGVRDRERAYTTQALYEDEPNINLAFVDLNLKTSEWRGRVAVQEGTSVKSNYAAEPDIAIRHIQESYIGYKLSDKLWLDGGIFFSHIGPEGWISRDNWTYTRSLISEYTPYYQTGAKLTYDASESLTLQLLALRGWQNISDNEQDWGGGTQIAYKFDKSFSISHNTFIGDQDNLRVLNDIIFRYDPTDKLGMFLAIDVGHQDRTQGESTWYGVASVVNCKWSDDVSTAFRLERFSDPDQVIAATLTGADFKINGTSVNIDLKVTDGLIWRTEYKVLFSDEDIFKRKDGRFGDSTQLLVTSLSLTLS